MEIYLIRHTRPLLSPGLIYGHLDVPLAEGSEIELTAVKAKLPRHFDRVYSSPSGRCTRLAERICAGYQIDNRLREMHFGDWEGETWDTIDQNDLKFWADDFVNVCVPGGESMLDLQKRVSSFWEELLEMSYRKVAIVTHGGVIRLILGDHKKLELCDIFNIEVDYGDVYLLQDCQASDAVSGASTRKTMTIWGKVEK